MYLTTDKTLEENEAIWTGMPAITAAKTRLNSNVSAISNYSYMRENDSTGETLVKHQSRTDLEKAIQKIIGGMIGYTTAENLIALRQNINYQPWQLTHARDNELCDIATAVYMAALPCKEKLIPFMVTDEDFVALDTLKTEYPKTIPGKRVAGGANTAAKEAMKLLFKDTDKLLKDTLDNLMIIYRVPQPEFYSKYLVARVVVELGHGKKRVRPTTDSTAVVSGKE